MRNMETVRDIERLEMHDMGRFPACRMADGSACEPGHWETSGPRVESGLGLIFSVAWACSLHLSVQKRYEMRGKLDDKVDIDKNDINSKFGWVGRFLIEAWGNCCQQWLDLHGA